MFKKISIAASTLWLLPAFAFAQPSSGLGGIGRTVDVAIDFINGFLVPAVFAIAFLLFIWGMFNYFILGGGSDDSRKTGRQLMLWGVVAFVMMVSVWGIVNVVAEGLNFDDPSIDNKIPDVPTTR